MDCWCCYRGKFICLFAAVDISTPLNVTASGDRIRKKYVNAAACLPRATDPLQRLQPARDTYVYETATPQEAFCNVGICVKDLFWIVQGSINEFQFLIDFYNYFRLRLKSTCT